MYKANYIILYGNRDVMILLEIRETLKKKNNKFRARHWNSTLEPNDVLLYKIILWQPLNSLQVTNNPNSSLLWRFTVWKQYFSRQIVCIHATHTTRTTHTYTQTWSHANARIRENRFRRKKKGMHPRDFIK